jgi:hypothetical protein
MYRADELIGCTINSNLHLYAIRTNPKTSGLKVYEFKHESASSLTDLHRLFSSLLSTQCAQAPTATLTTNSTKMFFIVNPYSGSRRGVRIMELVRPIFLAGGIEPVVHITTHAGHARELARSAVLTDYVAIVTVGGDGTVNEAVTGVLENTTGGCCTDAAASTSIPIGIIPAGWTLPAFVPETNALLSHSFTRTLTLSKIGSGGENPAALAAELVTTAHTP